MNAIPKRKLSTSMEDYLEAIGHLERENRVARVRDIARLLEVQMPSVTGALKALKQRGLVDYERNSFIRLTGRGRSLARDVQARHEMLRCFLESVLNLPASEAQEQACRMEHAVTTETALRLGRLTDFFHREVIGKGGLSPQAWRAVLEGERGRIAEDGIAGDGGEEGTDAERDA